MKGTCWRDIDSMEVEGHPWKSPDIYGHPRTSVGEFCIILLDKLIQMGSDQCTRFGSICSIKYFRLPKGEGVKGEGTVLSHLRFGQFENNFILVFCFPCLFKNAFTAFTPSPMTCLRPILGEGKVKAYFTLHLLAFLNPPSTKTRWISNKFFGR